MSDFHKIGVVELSKYFFTQLRWQFLNGVARTENIGFKEGKEHIKVHFQPVYFETTVQLDTETRSNSQLTADAFTFAIDQLFGGIDYAISDVSNRAPVSVSGNVVLRF